MTDRISGFVVALDHDMRDDDVKPTLDALRHIKGVLSVEPVGADPLPGAIATTRVRSEIANHLADVAYRILAGKPLA